MCDPIVLNTLDWTKLWCKLSALSEFLQEPVVNVQDIDFEKEFKFVLTPIAQFAGEYSRVMGFKYSLKFVSETDKLFFIMKYL